MSNRNDLTQERKNQILEAAMRVFARSGFDKARMDDIVAESGLSKGTLYWYFDSKDEIISTILENMFDEELAHLKGMQKEGSASEKILAFTTQTIADLDEMRWLFPLTLEFYALALRQQNVEEVLRKYLHAYLEILTPIIQQGIDQGEFQTDNAQDIAVEILALFEGTLLLSIFDRDVVNLEKNIELGTRKLLDGLRVP
jgi:AcrR family transcriptional regulator